MGRVTARRRITRVDLDGATRTRPDAPTEPADQAREPRRQRDGRVHREHASRRHADERVRRGLPLDLPPALQQVVDRPLQLAIMLWALVAVLVLYILPPS